MTQCSQWKYNSSKNITLLCLSSFTIAAVKGASQRTFSDINSVSLLTRSTHAPVCVTDWQEHWPLSLENVCTISTLASYGLDETVFVLDSPWPVVTFFWLRCEGSVIVKWFL